MAKRGWRIAGRIFKYLGIVLVFSITGFMIWRMFSSGDPSGMKPIMVNENTVRAYDASGDGSLYMFYQGQNDITRGEKNAGYFSVSQVAFIPEAHQLQVVVRYNNSTLRSVAKDLGLSEVPDRDADVFDVTVAISTDLTPDDDSDNDLSAKENPKSVSETRYHPSGMKKDKKNVYNYRKFIFDGIDIDEKLTLAVYLDIRYAGGGEVNYDEEALGTLCLYDYASKNRERSFSSADRDAILSFKKENGEV